MISRSAIITSVLLLVCAAAAPVRTHQRVRIPVNIVHEMTSSHVGYDNCDPRTNGEFLVIEHFIHDHDVIVDAGANVGNWSLQVLMNKKSVKLYAFEPYPPTFNQLVYNLRRHPVICFNSALGKQEGVMRFFFYPSYSEMNSLYVNPGFHGEMYQETHVTVETLAHKTVELGIPFINFLKINCEGAEFDIVSGAAPLIESQAIDYIQFEYGGGYQGAKTTLKQVFDLFTHNGYAIFRIYQQGLIYIDEWYPHLENYRYANYLAISAKEFAKMKVPHRIIE